MRKKCAASSLPCNRSDMRKPTVISFFFLFIFFPVAAQTTTLDLSKGWQFRKAGTAKWYPATVPGSVHTDLLNNKLIPDPFYADNEKKLAWIDRCDWEYQLTFQANDALLAEQNIRLVFDGLDTYADVSLNGKSILKADNMFRNWTVFVKDIVKKNNKLIIRFHSALNTVDSIAKSRLPLVLPDNNRVYARKAQFQFGWDWGPLFVGCGIWKKIQLQGWTGVRIMPTTNKLPSWNVKLVQQKGTAGTSFYFEKDGNPVYIKGANYIPSDVFLPRVGPMDYYRIVKSAKDANMNMLRVWGGGIYEDDAFYDQCDKMGIMVWQDFMFAGGMYPGDEAFFKNVKEEVRYQINRLKDHPCIVLWCGNNEIDEAWHHWGWQGQFNLHGADSAKVWNDYTRLFRDSLPKWVNEFDGHRPYVSTSPQFGWGNPRSYNEGDSHYWGVWWGLADWEIFEQKTGRFVSEYGMQAMPNVTTVNGYTPEKERYLYSPSITSHQKANDGFKKLNHYLNRYFIDSSRLKQLPLADYIYLTQCLQYYILKNSIAVHRSKAPRNMGTLLWQLNDCWPVTSWSITDYSRAPKAAWYAVKEAYRDDRLPVKDSIIPMQWQLKKPTFTLKYTGDGNFSIVSDQDAAYVYLYKDNGSFTINDNYFSLKAGEVKTFRLNRYSNSAEVPQVKIKSLYDVLTHK